MADHAANNLAEIKERTAREKNSRIDDLNKRYRAERERICQEAAASEKEAQDEFEVAAKACREWSPPWIRPCRDYDPSVYTPRPEDREDREENLDLERFGSTTS